MSAITLSLISIFTMLGSFTLTLYLAWKKKFKGFDGVVFAVVFTLFVAMAAGSTVLGAYGFNMIRNGGNNGAGLSLSRD